MPQICPCCGTVISSHNDLNLLPLRHSLMIEDQEIQLSKTLFNLLSLLHERMPNYVSHESIMAVLYADHLDPPNDTAVKMHIMKLRRLLKATELNIITLWGVGYRLELSEPISVKPYKSKF